ncbi:peptidoglycan recognition family protein [uncultured Clostridium sp.]|uniref:peptidoglycan recognition protein family protein n=1 Tax=uncultured Clostridium sp. TaxID=59620 RepID=UPI0025DF6108|nr:peptidoglycan recognition family protein [uncultured Clostridium sp.]
MIEVHKLRKVKLRRKRRRRLKYLFLFILLIVFFIGGRSFLLYKKANSTIKYLNTMGKGEYDIRNIRDKREEFENALNIKEVNYGFDDNLKFGNNPKVLVYHHTASSKLDPEVINKDHKEKGWGGIGYHFYIRKDGSIFRGRPEECIGAHAIGRNYDSIGICLEGNFENEDVNEKQKEALINLSIDMIIKYNLEDSIGHKDVYETLCPGAHFPMEEVKEKISNRILNQVSS